MLFVSSQSLLSDRFGGNAERRKLTKTRFLPLFIIVKIEAFSFGKLSDMTFTSYLQPRAFLRRRKALGTRLSHLSLMIYLRNLDFLQHASPQHLKFR